MPDDSRRQGDVGQTSGGPVANNVLAAISSVADEIRPEIDLKAWYTGKDAVDSLQLIINAGSSFEGDNLAHVPQSSFSDRDSKTGGVTHTGNMREADAGQGLDRWLSSWTIGSALLDFHLDGQNDSLLGSDVPSWQGKNFDFLGISTDVLMPAEAGSMGQDIPRLRAFSGLQEGLAVIG